MDAMKFGQFIAEMRKESHMTQAELAAKIMVTDKAISRWERGLGFPDIASLGPLSEALGISVTELLNSEKDVSADNTSVSDEAISNVIEMANVQYAVVSKKSAIICGLALLVLISIIAREITGLPWHLILCADVVLVLTIVLGKGIKKKIERRKNYA